MLQVPTYLEQKLNSSLVMENGLGPAQLCRKFLDHVVIKILYRIPFFLPLWISPISYISKYAVLAFLLFNVALQNLTRDY